jgi:polar amino acid transport system permease protein
VNYETVPLLMVASLWYLAVTSVLTIGQYYVERYYARGAVRELPPTPMQRLRARISGRSPAAPASNALAAEELMIFGQQNKD